MTTWVDYAITYAAQRMPPDQLEENLCICQYKKWLT